MQKKAEQEIQRMEKEQQQRDSQGTTPTTAP
jgi:hypothetical protein